MVVDLKDYLTEDEQAAFVPGYITEGDFDGSGSIKFSGGKIHRADVL